MQPYFSIITPVYNCRRYIRKCIESVINQTYKSWELILVDDGSTDSSDEICDSYCYDSRIKVIHQDNAGQLFSRVKGIKIAQGIYELGLDADDFLDDNCLEIIKKAIDISRSDMIFFGYRNIGSQIGSVRCSLKSEKIYLQKDILKEIIENTNHSLCNKAIKMDIVKQAGCFRTKRRLDINEDYVQIVSILSKINTTYVINDVLYNYRIYGKSISHSCKVKHIFDVGWSTMYVAKKLKRDSLIDSDIYNVINLAYLKMIEPRLLMLYDNKGISRKDCRKIHKSEIYKQSKEMESRKYFNKYDFLILKLFRYRQYWMLRIVTQLRKL